jgi:hypothetical protein
MHGTIKKIPQEVFEQEEKGFLKQLPILDFIMPQIVTRKAGYDCHITVDSSYYSIPYEYVGKKLEVHQDNKLLQIYHEDKLVALHNKSNTKGEFITNQSHYPKYKYFTPESQEYRLTYKQKMQTIGDYASLLFSKLLTEEPYRWYRIACGILNLCKVYSNEVINLSCKRALEFQVFKYKTIKKICETGSYNLPPETNHEYETKILR